MTANPVFACTLVSTADSALGSRAQEKPATPDAANAPVRLATSSQGKTAGWNIVDTPTGARVEKA